MKSGPRERALYRATDVAEEYNDVRLRRGGLAVHETELTLVEELLGSPAGPVLDVASGTGRVAKRLESAGALIVAVDASRAMLEAAGPCTYARVQASADALPFKDGVFAAATSLRFFIHIQEKELTPFLLAIRRVTRGPLILDTANALSAKWLTIVPGRIGGRRAGQSAVWAIRNSSFARRAAAAGWRVRERRDAFFVPVGVYRFLPLAMARLLLRMDRVAQSAALRSAAFWRLDPTEG